MALNPNTQGGEVKWTNFLDIVEILLKMVTNGPFKEKIWLILED